MAKKPINELDFPALKEQFIQYLRNQTQFKDYNFEGSNMNVLLDILSYNTFQNNYYTNMAINEMFLDSAVLRNSVISHAKELNYIPRSMQSAKAVVRLTINDPNETNLNVPIPKFTEFTSSHAGSTFTFITNKVHVARKVSDGVFVADNVDIYEGLILTGFEKEGFFLDEDGELRCNLTNDDIDIRTIEVFVDEEADSANPEYQYKNDIFGVSPTDQVFYLSPYFDNRYSVYFGRNIFGKQPQNFEDIKIQYRVTNGTEANGASKFSTSFKSNTTVETIEMASGGTDRESIESIRFFAPKSIQIQERAVTANDYEILLKQQFPEIRSISVYGGDELEPPQFGKVAISVNLQGSDLLSSSSKSEYTNYIIQKSPLTIEPIFVDPEFLFAELKVNIYYSRNSTSKSMSEIETIVRNTISTYNQNNLDDFGAKLRLSKLSSAIDDSDESIISNSIVARPIIEYKPELNIRLNPTFKFNTELVKPYPFRSDTGFSEYKPAINSSVFSYRGVCALLQDDGNGNIQIITSDNVNTKVIQPKAGTINYSTGEIRLINFITDGYSNSAIKIFASTATDDILSPKSRVFLLRDTDVIVDIVESSK